MQRGYILPTTLILLALLAATAVGLSERRIGSARINAEESNAKAALLLAENAADWVYGQFIYGGDLDGNGLPDHRQQGNLSANPPRTPTPYIFFLGDQGAATDTPTPTLLQRIAETEAGGLTTATAGPRIQDLFGARQRPLHFVTDETGLPVPTEQTWTEVADRPHTVVWMELIPDPVRGGYRLYLQSAARVGEARRYLQRLVGFYTNRLGRDLGTITESSRGRPPELPREDHHDDDD